MHPRVGLLTIGRKRPGFDIEWGRQIENQAWEAAGGWDLEPLRPAIRVVDDATLRAALAELRAADCDALVVMQPIMGDGRLAPLLAQLWDDPLVFWATPERQDGGKVSSCSLVGTHVFATILRQLDRPFELAYGHPEQAETREQVERAVRVCVAAAKLRQAKVGVVGSHAPGFINMHADPATLSRTFGVQLHQFGLRDFYGLVESRPFDAVRDDLARVEELALPFAEEVTRDDLTMNSRYYLAMQTLLDEEHLDALALRCWPELPNVYEAWPYLAMARLSDEGCIVALEGDVDGAVSCLIGRLLGIGTGYLTDWLEHAGRRLTMWHPGHAPPSLCVPDSLRLGRHFNTGHPLVLH
ncbi:MAG: sugar isomerase, partial [Planctomycetes bacterium]|nr:sugar isomerase [Planctomycetota bacterium]